MAKETERQLVSFDWAIKRLLRSKANFKVLEGFLSELLFDDIKIVEVLESESNKDAPEDKSNRVDIKVKNKKGEIVIIEVQSNNESDFFQRVLYATSKNVCEHIKIGEKYRDVVKVISVSILYFNLGEGSDYIYKGSTNFLGFHNQKQLRLNSKQRELFKKEYPEELFPEYYIIKVNNFNKVAKDPLDQWMYLLKNSAVKSSFRAKGIQEAGKALDIMKMSKEERQAYERYIDHKQSEISQYNTALMEGQFKERKIQEAKIKQMEDTIQQKDDMLQQKDNLILQNEKKHQEEIQQKEDMIHKKDDNLQQLANLLLKSGYTKEQIFKETGIKL